jgi:hypothetical protein
MDYVVSRCEIGDDDDVHTIAHAEFDRSLSAAMEMLLDEYFDREEATEQRWKMIGARGYNEDNIGDLFMPEKKRMTVMITDEHGNITSNCTQDVTGCAMDGMLHTAAALAKEMLWIRGRQKY